jgi:hypothetical protein
VTSTGWRSSAQVTIVLQFGHFYIPLALMRQVYTQNHSKWIEAAIE